MHHNRRRSAKIWKPNRLAPNAGSQVPRMGYYTQNGPSAPLSVRLHHACIGLSLSWLHCVLAENNRYCAVYRILAKISGSNLWNSKRWKLTWNYLINITVMRSLPPQDKDLDAIRGCIQVTYRGNYRRKAFQDEHSRRKQHMYIISPSKLNREAFSFWVSPS